MKKLRIQTPSSDYTAHIGRGQIDTIPAALKAAYPKSRFALITDDNVGALYGARFAAACDAAGLDCLTIRVAPGEKTKNLSVFGDILRQLAQHGFNRADVIVAFGGGVVGDLAGFVAAVYLRGVRYVQVPTTLLAQIDSSVGGKTAINIPEGKNLIGAFHHPSAVYIDADFLTTLPPGDFASGMAELIKYAMIRDTDMMQTLEQIGRITADTPVLPELIVRCLEIKRNIVAADELDKGERMLLNFGHTIGHALERIGAARGIPITHGQGVARGMAVITAASERRGETEPGTTNRLLDLLVKAELPTDTEGFDQEEILDGILVDKKNIADTLNIILVSHPGGGFIKTIRRDEMSGYLSEGGL